MDASAPVYDWPDEHKEYWLSLAATARATGQQARFAYGLSTGMSQTAAARFAGYRGEARTAGYHAARCKAVSTLLALAEGDGWTSPNQFVTEEEKDKLLTQLMRSGDPTARLRAIEQADKRRERKLERERQAADAELAQFDPRETLKRIAECAPLIAVMLARQHGIPLEMTPMSIGHALAEIEKMRAAVMRYHANAPAGSQIAVRSA